MKLDTVCVAEVLVYPVTLIRAPDKYLVSHPEVVALICLFNFTQAWALNQHRFFLEANLFDMKIDLLLFAIEVLVFHN